MSCCTPWKAALILALAVVAPAAARAQKLEKEEKKWLDEVRPIMLPDEEKIYKNLKDKADRAEFQKIFWARRDPNLETQENEYQEQYLSARNEANTQIRVSGRQGADTDCGRTLILLGKPDDVQKATGSDSPGARGPETWTYKDRPGGPKFEGGKVEMTFDADCTGPAGFNDQLNRVAEARILQPNINYRFGPDKHLVKLVDQLPKPSPAQALLKTPRQDFPVSTQATFIKVQDGGTALLGLVKGDAGGLTVADVGGKKTVKVVVAAQAKNDEGKVAAFAEQPVTAEVGADGSFVASYRMQLKPGKYSVEAGALDEKNGKGSLTTVPVDVPSFSQGELTATVLILQNVEDLPEGAKEDSQHPFAAFEMPKARLVPYFGQVLTKNDTPSFFYQFYDAQVDPATGKASGSVALSVLKDGKAPVAKAESQPFDSPVGGSVVGPVPLAKYEPGKYVVQIRINDKVANKEKTFEVPFEVKP
jgi:GWxTD domain-containing protein